jgi:hypothetical protein
MQEEIWKDLPTYEGLYQVSNLGNVKSFRNPKERILKPSITNSGYARVVLYKSDLKKYIAIHQIVAMAFLNHVPCGHKLVVDHKNDNKLDNRLENLQIISQRENACRTQGNYSSQHKGVYWNKEINKWISAIRINGKKNHLGSFKCELAASMAYQKKLKEIR